MSSRLSGIRRSSGPPPCTTPAGITVAVNVNNATCHLMACGVSLEVRDDIVPADVAFRIVANVWATW